MSDFYKNIIPATLIAKVLTEENYQVPPEDWHVVITDVISSTKAIDSGRYKDVNTAGGIAAMAVSNVVNDMEYPFIFGGDGVTFLIPGEYINTVKDVLIDTKRKVKTFFDLELRVGSVSIRELNKMKKEVKVAKLLVSKYYVQAIVKGDGVDYAEELIKKEMVHNPYLVTNQQDMNIAADFTGFTCRWQDVPSHLDETISLIVKKNPSSNKKETEVLQEVMSQMEKSFGKDEDFQPIKESTLTLANRGGLSREIKVQSNNSRGFSFLFQWISVNLQQLIVKLVVLFQIPLIKKSIYIVKDVKKYNVISSDYKKYDGSLKMVLCCKKSSREDFEKYLEGMYQVGDIFYGVHVSNRALLTCLLHNASEREVHFVDSGDGGYAMAAKVMKRQIKQN